MDLLHLLNWILSMQNAPSTLQFAGSGGILAFGTQHPEIPSATNKQELWKHKFHAIAFCMKNENCFCNL